MSDAIQSRLLPAGLHARLREAVERMRLRGIGHPVAVYLEEGSKVSIPDWSIEVRLEASAGWRVHVVAPEDARRMLSGGLAVLLA